MKYKGTGGRFRLLSPNRGDCLHLKGERKIIKKFFPGNLQAGLFRNWCLDKTKPRTVRASRLCACSVLGGTETWGVNAGAQDHRGFFFPFGQNQKSRRYSLHLNKFGGTINVTQFFGYCFSSTFSMCLCEI